MDIYLKITTLRLRIESREFYKCLAYGHIALYSETDNFVVVGDVLCKELSDAPICPVATWTLFWTVFATNCFRRATNALFFQYTAPKQEVVYNPFLRFD